MSSSERENVDTDTDTDWDTDTDTDWDPAEDFELVIEPTSSTTDGDTVTVDPGLVDAVNAAAPDFSAAIAAHLAAHGQTTPAEFPLDRGYIARTGPRCGLGRYVTYTDQADVEHRRWEPVTDWLAWRARQRTTHGIGPDHRLTPEAAIEHDVKIADARGRCWTVTAVPSAESASTTVVDRAAAPLAVPHTTAHRAAVGNMIRLLGSSSMTVEQAVASTGWVLGLDPARPNRVTFLAPAGSVTADGVTTDPLVVPPMGSTGTLPPAMAAIGFAGADVPPEKAIEAVALFMGMLERPVPTVALLGALFSSPLCLVSRPVVMVAGKTDSGKTLLASALLRFVATVESPRTAPLFGFDGSSEAGVRARASWARDMVVLADDYRRNGDDRRVNEQSDALLTSLAQIGYGAGEGAKSTREGGTRTPAPVHATLIVTSETTPPDPAIRNRLIVVGLSPADGLVHPGTRYDRYRDCAANLPRSLMADYLRWLAGRIDAHADEPGGGLAALARVANGDAKAWYQASGLRRAAESVGGLAAGWKMFRRYAAARGLLDALPSDELVDAALIELARTNDIAATQVDPGVRLVVALRDAVRSSAGHLLSTDGHEPEIGAFTGWVTRLSEGKHSSATNVPSGPTLGVVTADGRAIYVTRQHVQAIARLAHLDGLHATQLHEAISSSHMGPTRPGGRVPDAAVPGRPEGWLVPIERVLPGLGSEDTDSLDEAEA